jgi:hypothetical protein
MRNIQNILDGESEKKRHSENLRPYGRIIFKGLSKRMLEDADWIFWLRIVSSGLIL